METKGERRRRKLELLAADTHGGLGAIAHASGLSKASLDQVIKVTLLPPKQDGTRARKQLGDPAAEAIEDALKLGRGWFDSDDSLAGGSTETLSTPPPGAPQDDVPPLLSALYTVTDALEKTDKATRASVSPLFSFVGEVGYPSGNIAIRIFTLLNGVQVIPPSGSNPVTPSKSTFAGGKLPRTKRGHGGIDKRQSGGSKG